MIDVRSRGIANSKGTNLLNAIHVQIQDTPEAAEKDEKEDKEDKDDKQDKWRTRKKKKNSGMHLNDQKWTRQL